MYPTKRRTQPHRAQTADTTMRTLTLSLIIAFSVILSGASNAGSSDNLPNAGLFQVVR